MIENAPNNHPNAGLYPPNSTPSTVAVNYLDNSNSNNQFVNDYTNGTDVIDVDNYYPPANYRKGSLNIFMGAINNINNNNNNEGEAAELDIMAPPNLLE